MNDWQNLTVVVVLCAASAVRADDVPAARPAAGRPGPALTRVAFGSCAREDREQPIWDAIVAAEPELFLFLGDNIYGDSDDMAVLRQKWQTLGAVPGYARLKSICPILATWDDHDYGRNDAGGEYPFKRESQQVFLDFFDEPADSPRRRSPGVFDARSFGPEGRRVQILLLDTRYFRSPLVNRDWRPEPGEGDRGPYGRNLDPAATLLGDMQWSWLADRLREPAELRIIASSIQVVADDHSWEKWGNFPLERARLFELIRETGATGVFIVSGDRHSAEISAVDPGVGYPLIDVTSSSLNQPLNWENEPNRHRIGLKYFGPNFGMLVVDWEQSDPVLRFQVRNVDGDVVLQHRVRLSELRP